MQKQSKGKRKDDFVQKLVDLSYEINLLFFE